MPLNTPGQKAAWVTFTGSVGQRLSVRMTTTSGTFCLASPLVVLKPDDTTLSTVTGCGSVFIEPTELTMTGMYKVLIDPNGPATGPATLYLYDVVDISGPITPDGPAVTLPFSTPGQKARLSFSGTTGQRVSVRLTTSPQSACVAWPLAVRNLDETTVGSPVSACGTTFLEPVTLPTSGAFTVFVDPSGPTVPTTAAATLYVVAPDVTGTLTINGSAIAVPIADPGQNGVLTFTGTVGQQVTVRMTGNTFSNVPVRLFRPDGTFQAIVASGAASFNMAPQTLSMPGPYTVTVNPTEIITGTVNVAVTSP